jgi:bifunctional non-homologous end joining protein LigD
LARIKYASHIGERGENLYAQVAKLEVEGIVAKRADSPYKAGKSKDWLKIKTPAGKAMEDHRLRHLKN